MKGKITKLLQLVQIDYNQNKWCAKGNQEKFQKNENLLMCPNWTINIHHVCFKASSSTEQTRI